MAKELHRKFIKIIKNMKNSNKSFWKFYLNKNREMVMIDRSRKLSQVASHFGAVRIKSKFAFLYSENENRFVICSQTLNH